MEGKNCEMTSHENLPAKRTGISLKTRLGLTLIAVIAPAIALTIIQFLSPIAQAETAAKMKEKEDIIRQNMLTITRQLGTTCVTCHNPENFKSDEKLPFKTAKYHIKVTQILIDNGMNGKNNSPKADCYMCHRGQLHPDWKEKIDPMVKDPALGEKRAPEKDAPAPDVD